MTKLPERRERSVVKSSVMPSTKNSCSGSFDRLAKGRTTIDNRGRADGTTALPASRVRVVGPELDAAGIVGAHRPRNVLDAVLANVLEDVGELVADLVAHHPRDADAARLPKGLQAHGV